MIGTRKSVFLPFTNLGLIVMDEEHDSSYKQETSPRYHARDAAILRAKAFDCPLVLGSATPSLDTYARALKNVYHLVTLPGRALNVNNQIRPWICAISRCFPIFPDRSFRPFESVSIAAKNR